MTACSPYHDALEGDEIRVEGVEQFGIAAGAAAQFAVVVAIRFVPGDVDQLAVPEVRQAREIGGAQGEAQFAALP